MHPRDYEQLILHSNTYLGGKIAQAREQFGLGGYESFTYDVARARMWWSDKDGPKVKARITVVGTLSLPSKAWVWSWANPQFPANLLGSMETVKTFGHETAVRKISESNWEAEEVDGWEMTAIAARLLNAQAAYRSPTESGLLFLLLDDVKLVKPAEANELKASANESSL